MVWAVDDDPSVREARGFILKDTHDVLVDQKVVGRNARVWAAGGRDSSR
jgi:hypothetical protein